MICANCGKHSDSGAFCGYCGTKFPEEQAEIVQAAPERARCPNCGIELEEESRFCHVCGAPIKEQPPLEPEGKTEPLLEPEREAAPVEAEQAPPEPEAPPAACCPNCGIELEEESRFCHVCGAPIKEQPPLEPEGKTEPLLEPEREAAPAEPEQAPPEPEAPPAERCPNCGAAREEDGVFCAACGAPFGAAPAAQPQPQPRRGGGVLLALVLVLALLAGAVGGYFTAAQFEEEIPAFFAQTFRSAQDGGVS